MNRILRIDAVDRAVPPFSAVLAPLAPEARTLHWSVLDLGEVVPGEGWDQKVPYSEPRVLDSPGGWH